MLMMIVNDSKGLYMYLYIDTVFWGLLDYK